MVALSEAGCAPAWNFVRACLRADGSFLDEERRTQELYRNLNSVIVDALRHLGRPAHFTEVAATLNELGLRRTPVSSHSVHGRLVGARDLFVYTGPGTYALAEWGMDDRREYDRSPDILIGDLCEQFLEEWGEPAARSEIVAYVLSRKRCREFSIVQRLFYDERFCEFTKGSYGLRKWVF
jgi:hypothetical protein